VVGGSADVNVSSESGKPMLDNDVYLVLKIFHRNLTTGPSEEFVPDQYIEKYHSYIKSAGTLFQYLGLAEPDESSPLGWRPTALFMSLIANCAPKSTTRKFYKIGFLIPMLLDAVYGDTRGNSYCSLALDTLIGIGLVRENEEKEVYEASHELVELINDSYPM
jgi:hypothetical protein